MALYWLLNHVRPKQLLCLAANCNEDFSQAVQWSDVFVGNFQFTSEFVAIFSRLSAFWLPVH